MDPYKFFFECQQKYGDCFTFILLGMKTTVYLGAKGNDFILNGKHKDLNAEDIYNPLCAPVFGPGVVYDCPNAKLMEQKKMIKSGLATEALKTYVPLMVAEIQGFLRRSPALQGSSGVCNILPLMAELIMNTATRSLQGKEVREKFDSSFASLFHDLDMGFSSINFMFPRVPFPHNRKRDHAQRTMTGAYLEIMERRREKMKQGVKTAEEDKDLIWSLMDSKYKDGTPISDREIAHMMLALLLAGQHSAGSTISWIMTRLAYRPDIIEELYQEQVAVLGSPSEKDNSGFLPEGELTLDDINRLELVGKVVKETLRLHSPIHSIMRRATSSMPVVAASENIKGANTVIPAGHNLIAAPGFMARQAEFFPDPMEWDPHRWDADSPRGMVGAGLCLSSSSKSEVPAAVEMVDYGYGSVAKVTSSPYLPFGAGRHRCIGENFAYLQLATALSVMVREFKWTKPHEGAEMAKTDYSSMFSAPMSPSNIRWERRRKVDPESGSKD